MGFKLGSERGNYAIGGEIKTKLKFNKTSGDPDVCVPYLDLVEKKGQGEANMDGSIYISNDIIPGSFEERQVINHEMRHATDMKLGKLEYSDNHIKYNGEFFERKTIKGKDMIIVDGVPKEAGSHDFPWEVDANNGTETTI